MNTPLLFGRLRPADAFFTPFFNRETDTILRGEPVCYPLDGTNDGIDGVHASTVGANKCKAHCIGVCTQNTPTKQYGVAQTWGLNKFVRCSASVSANTCLVVNSASNDFAGGATEATYDGVASVGPATLPFAITAIATATVQGVANVSARALLRFL